MRFDTDGTADFNLTITEDNPNERLGLVWTFVFLNENMEEIALTKKVMHSHDLDVNTSISPITMGGTKKKTISVSSADIQDDLDLASGALRVYACVYDEWNAAATATVDVLINRLPEFADLVGEPAGTKLAVKVPNVSDNNEDYSFFKEPYSYIGSAPVFLINQPTMYLDCQVNAKDFEMDECGLNLNTSCDPAKQVIWKFDSDALVKPENAAHTSTLSSQGARFGTGKNTVRVELRDTFYYSYKGRFKDLASASLSMDFYIWESQSHNLPSQATAATNIYKMPSTPNSFYVQYSTNNNYINRFEIQSQNKYLSGPIIPGNIYADQQMSTRAEENGNYTYTVATTTLISGIKDYNAKINILTLLSPVDNNDFVMLTDTKAVASPTAIKYRKVDSSYLTIENNTVDGNIPNVWIPYMRVPDLGETYYRDYLCNNLLIKFKNEEPSSSNQLLNGASKGINTYGYPGNDDNYMNRVISMTQTNVDNGAMLIRSWKGTPGNDILAPFDTTYYTYPNENSFRPLSVLDGKALKLTENSKVRFLKDLGLQNKLFVTDTNNNRIIRVANDFSEAYSINVGNPLDVSECSNSTVFVLSDYKDGVATLAISLFNVTDKSYEKACEPFGKLITDASKRNNEFYRVGKFMNPKAMYYYYGSDGYGGLVVLEDGTGSFKSRVQVIRTTMKYWITD